MNSIRIAAILVAIVATACSGGPVSPSAVASSPPSATAEPTAAASAPATDALTGTWATAAVTCDQQNATLAAAGFTADQLTLARWDPTCAQGSPGTQYAIRFASGRLVIFLDGQVGWDGTYRIVDGDTFEAGDVAGAGFFITYQYAVQGDTLTIDMVRDDYPNATAAALAGELVAQTVIYETSPFTRQHS
jgi:hypothetical protein